MGDSTVSHLAGQSYAVIHLSCSNGNQENELLGRIYIEGKRDHRNVNRFWLPMVKIIPVSTMAYTGTLVPKPAWRLRITTAERGYVHKLIEFYKSLYFGVEVSRS